ncbi:MAG: carboxypeptidase-like regulatory domain-containing protein [Ferruginibacter sp.]
MLFNLTKRSKFRNSLFIFTALLFFSCQKEFSIDNAGVNPLPDLTTKISSSVSGFVTDENNAAVLGATVQFGTSTMITDEYGYFEAKNIQVVKNAAFVSVSKPGYFKGIKTYMAKQDKAAFFRIKLIPKTIAGNINGGSGGIVSLTNGLSIKLPAGAVVNAATNAAYTGSVNVAAFWINPEAADLDKIMPGDLRGINTEGAIKILQTYGMAAVELTGTSGELLQIANGRNATLTLPIPSSLSASAPATIPLWYFDEANGLWKEQGSAVKTGNTYVGDVSHFSFWNCDFPGPMVQFDCTLKDATGNPLTYTLVKISVVSTGNARYGYTDFAGYVSGLVPANSNLLLEVYANFNCGPSIFSQTFATTNANISLGTLIIPTTNNLATITGSVTNCANTPVTNGYILLQEGNVFTRYSLNNLGAFSFNLICCSFPQTIILIGEDLTNAQQSASITYNVTNAGTNPVGNIQACGTTTQQFINYTINSINYSFSAPADTFTYSNNNQSAIGITGVKLPNTTNNVNFAMDNAGIGAGSNQNLQKFNPSQVSDTFRITTPIFVNITEYGAVGQFAAGTFTGIFTGASPGNIQYNVTCNFRIRRNN